MFAELMGSTERNHAIISDCSLAFATSSSEGCQKCTIEPETNSWCRGHRILRGRTVTTFVVLPRKRSSTHRSS